MNLEKLFVAVTTPFKENCDIDADAFRNHLQYIEQKGIDAIFLGGTTGEFDALTFQEKEELLKIGREAFSGLIAFNVSSTALRESLELVKIAEKHDADAITALPPYYRAEVGEEGVAAFFNAISDATELPLILYNFTRHTQNAISPSLMKMVTAEVVKDSDKSLHMIPDIPLYLCAGDSIIADAVAQGAKGVVSVQGNYRPKPILELFKTSSSDTTAAAKMQNEVAEVSALFRKNKQIARIKCALSELIPGYPPYVRVPLIDLNESEREEIVSWAKA